MANQIIPGQPNDPRTVEAWVHIDDFHAGCYDNSFISTQDPKFAAPLGAADAMATYCCAANNTGVLGPLPKLSQKFGYAPPFPGSTTTLYIVGFALNPALSVNNPELVIILEGDDGAGHYVIGYSYLPTNGSANLILDSTSASTPGFFGAPYPEWTRMALDPSTTNPTPELVFPTAVSTDSAGNSGHLYIYPPILAPTTFAVQDLIVAHSSTTGQVIAYGNRVIVATGILYPWPSGGGTGSNENLNYTDPPNSTFYGNQKVIFGTEEPWGYGAWGTVSVGELLLIKKVGGAVALYGDINDPTSAIPLPGVQSTGDFVGSADASQIGLVYCSQNQGAWVWNGGNTSQKISAQLRDDFYDASSTVIQSNNYGFYVEHWQDWLLFSNNYMYNPDTQSWWVLYPTEANGNATVPGQTYWWFKQGNEGNQMFAAPLSIENTGPQWFVIFDSTIPANHYQWTSLPIHVVPNAARLVDVLQVFVRASDPTGTEQATVTVTIGGQSQTNTTTIGTTPTLFRLDFGSASLGLDDIEVTLNCDNPEGCAPYIHSLDIGYKTRALQAADN